MKKLCILAGVLCLGMLVQAEVIEKIFIQQTSGATAQYTYADGQLNWSSGGFTYMVTENGGFFSFDSADLDATFDLYSDDSSGGTASARFDLVGNWTFSLFSAAYGTSPVVIVSGDLYNGGAFGGKYWESEGGFERLDGKAWVTVGSVWANPVWAATEVLGQGFDSLAWDDDNTAGLDSDITLDAGIGDLLNYGQDYTSTNGLTVTLWADQSQVVPEPLTMTLLGMGILFLRKR